MNKLKSEPRELVDGKTLGERIREAFKFGVKTNVYTAIVRGFLDTILLDLDGRLQLKEIERRREGKIRRPLEGTFASFSREVSKMLHQIFRRGDTKDLLNEVISWVDEIYKAACSLFDMVFRFNLETTSRLTINTRDPYMPLEIGLAWHPYFNLPYIPASALKGATRSYFELRKINICRLDPNVLFGSKDREGVLIFFDALPISFGQALIEPDVINPHYPEVERRIDEISVRPRPLVYPTIAKGVRFSMVLAVNLKDRSLMHRINFREFMDEVCKHVKAALGYGLGARVSLGYGFLKINLVGVGGRRI